MNSVTKLCEHCPSLRNHKCKCRAEKSCRDCDMPKKVLLADRYGADESG